MMQDIVQRFIFEGMPIRGEIVSLEQAWQDIVARHHYPTVLKSILGELVAAACLLTSTLKFDGTLIMQLHGSGAVKLIVVECTSELKIRATAKWDNTQHWVEGMPLKELLKEGRFILTLDPKEENKQAYQGVVALEGESIAEIIMHYMRHSEQLDTTLWLCADEERAAGLLLQRLPDQEAHEEWTHINTLAHTITANELLSLNSTTLLQRLFYEEDIRVFKAEHIQFACTCSADKVGAMLHMLGQEETQSILDEQGRIEVHCEFCNTRYAYDPVDVAGLFAGAPPLMPTSTRQ